MTPHVAILPDRACIQIGGSARESFLQGVVSVDVTHIPSGTGKYGCLLTPQGKFLADFFITTIGDTFLLDCHTLMQATMLQKLCFYKLRADVTIEDGHDTIRVFVSWGGAPSVSDGWIQDPRLAALGGRSYVSTHSKIISDPTTQSDEYYAHCMALGVPSCGRDIHPEKSFPLDTNLDALNGMDYQKGCFIGQEVSSRMKRKGQLKKRIWQATFDGPALPVGAALHVDGAPIGEVTSSLSGRALVLLRLDRLGERREALCGNTIVNLTAPTYLTASDAR